MWMATRRMQRALTAALLLMSATPWLCPDVAAGVNYEYNAKGQLVRAEDFNGTVVTYQYDANGNRTSVTSIGGPDIKAPTVPLSVTAIAVSSTRIDVSWSASTDGGTSGLLGYKLERCRGSSCADFTQIITAAASPYQNTELAASTTYRYRLRAYDNAGNNSGYSTIVSATTTSDTTPPSAPGTLSATVLSSTSIYLSWGAASDSGGSELAGYRIERCQGAGCSDYAEIAQQVGTTYWSEALVASTAYRYRVRAYDNAGNYSTSYSNVASATTTADVIAPIAPSGLQAIATSPTSINLSWTASTDSGGSSLAGYKIERCQTANCSNYAQIATSPTNSYADATVSASTTYRYRVRAYDIAGNNSIDYSNVASATTPQDQTQPTAPTTLSASAPSSTQINLSWPASSDSGGNLSGYRIDRCQGNGCGTFAEIGTSATTTFADSGRAPLTTYQYRVRAYDAAGNTSGYSPTASATTPADTAPPSDPAITITTASSTQLNVSWSTSIDAGGSGLAGYKLERCTGAGCSGFAQIALLGSTTTSYSDSDRAASTTYVYRVRAYDNAVPANHSSYSASASGTTSADTIVPSPPIGLTASPASGTQINLSWQGSIDTGGSGLVGYKIERCAGDSCANFAQVATTGATTHTDSGRTDATTYRYRVRAYDGAGLDSGYSAIVNVTTPDITPPVITSLAFNGVTAHEATAQWTGSDNKRVASYQYSRDGGASWTSTGLAQSLPITGLASTATYSLRVRAFDAAGNVSSVVRL